MARHLQSGKAWVIGGDALSHLLTYIGTGGM